MYELSCPSCKHQISRPFVRIGAQAVCESCAHRFVVQKEYVDRRVTVPPDSGDDAQNPLLLDGKTKKPPAPPRAVAAAPTSPPPPKPADDGVPISKVAGTPTADIPELKPIHQIPAHQEPSPDVARVIARHRARRKRRGRLIAASIVFGLLVVAGVVALVMLSDPDAAGDDEPSLGDLAVQVVSAQRLDSAEWVNVDGEMFDGSLPNSSVKLVNDQMLPFSTQLMMYTADVEAVGMDVVEEATLHLILLDRGSRSIIARRQMPLMIPSGARTKGPRRPITVFVPRTLAERGRMVSWVQVKRLMPGGAVFPNVVYEPIGEGARTAIRITAFNPLDNAISRSVFLIRAFDERDATVARWRVVLNRDIGPQQRIEFAALTPVEPHWSVHTWEVVGAGGLNLGGDAPDVSP